MTVLGAWLGTAALSWLLGFPVYRWLVGKGIIDRPNERSSHTQPTARGGGIAIIGAVLVVLIAATAFPSGMKGDRTYLWLTSWAVLLAVISFIDDLRSVHPLWRFGCHAACAGAALFAIPWGGVHLAPWLPAAAIGLILFVWLTGYTNAFNFMDGINGIAGFQAALTGAGMALLGGQAVGWDHPAVLFSAVLGGAGAGFLPHNFPKARMFMGDVGSAPLGFLLAAAALALTVAGGWWMLPALAMLHANFVLDTGITLARRVARGEKWHLPHREHFYQRLIRAGKSHAFVTGWEAVLQLATLGLMYGYVRADAPGVRVVAAAAALAMWLAFFAACEVKFRKSQSV